MTAGVAWPLGKDGYPNPLWLAASILDMVPEKVEGCDMSGFQAHWC